uniref:Uncharacterized protein n=1 Tax=viral metagenome TaxID=1070528 RepID=A0A6M3XJS8_9ZZZZ
MRGISTKELFPYILEDDRGLPSEQQTIFYIKPKTGHEANIQTKVYLKAFREKDNGIRDLIVKDADIADLTNFKATVKKIENFAFPDDYYEDHPQVKEKAKPVKIHEDGQELKILFVKEITSEDMIGDVCRTLDNDSLREIYDVSRSVSKLREGQKK